MKAKFYLSSALMALALWGCSSDNLVVVDEPEATVAPGESGYISVSINLPTTPVTSTRSANDVFDDGDENEYAVNNAYLLLFAGDDGDEANATFHSLYALTTSWNDYTTDDETINQITRYSGIVQEITKPGNEHVYGLVVLNSDGMLNPSGTGTSASGYFGGVRLTSSTKFSDLQTTASAVDAATIANLDGSNFFMTNAPLSTNPGGMDDPKGETVSDDFTIKTLVEISSDCIYPTHDAASSAAKTVSFYVERGVAKVTVTDGRSAEEKATESEIYDSGGGTNAGYEFQGFILDNTNSQMFPVRNTTSSNDWWSYNADVTTSNEGDKYRFVGGNSVEPDVNLLYRTYWALDPNYDDQTVSLNSIAGTRPIEELTEIRDEDGETYCPLYCLENTFDVEHMKEEYTTRAIIAVKIGRESFCTIDGNSTRYYYFQDGDYTAMINYIREEMKGIPLIHEAMIRCTKYTEEDFIWLFTPANTLDHVTYHESFTVDFDHSTLSHSDFSDYGLEGDNPNISRSYYNLLHGLDEVAEDLNNDIIVNFYENGIAYFPVLIKHFGDELTPWDVEKDITGDNSYAGQTGEAAEDYFDENAFLGRYGVLRNNWYDIEVEGISGDGYPKVPEPENNYDDPAESWINVKINILSWAKRTQSAGLQ